MQIAYLENCTIHANKTGVSICGTMRLEFLNRNRSVLFMHVFKHMEGQACEKALDIFGYSSGEKDDIVEEIYLLKLYFDDKGWITDVDSLTEEQAKQIRLDIIKAMPDPEPPPRKS